jgi:hypothetical protein
VNRSSQPALGEGSGNSLSLSSGERCSPSWHEGRARQVVCPATPHPSHTKIIYYGSSCSSCSSRCSSSASARAELDRQAFGSRKAKLAENTEEHEEHEERQHVRYVRHVQTKCLTGPRVSGESPTLSPTLVPLVPPDGPTIHPVTETFSQRVADTLFLALRFLGRHCLEPDCTQFRGS